MLKSPCIPGINPTWSSCVILFIYFWFRCTIMLLSIFASIFMSYWSIISFLVYLGNPGFIKLVVKFSQVEIFQVLGITNEFSLYPELFGYFVMRLWILFNLLFSPQKVTFLGIMHRPRFKWMVSFLLDSLLSPWQMPNLDPHHLVLPHCQQVVVEVHYPSWPCLYLSAEH